jgi:hypothetical protein
LDDNAAHWPVRAINDNPANALCLRALAGESDERND